MEKKQIIASNNDTNTSKQDIYNIENTSYLSDLFDDFIHDNESDEDSIKSSELYFNKQEKNKDEYKSKPTIEKQSISNDSKDIKNKHLNIKRNRSKQKNNIKSLKTKKWKDFEELKKELVEIKEKNKEAFDLLEETPWKTFENVFTKINKKGFKYNVDKETINKFIKLIKFFSSEKAPNKINEENYQNLDFIFNNYENENIYSCVKLD